MNTQHDDRGARARWIDDELLIDLGEWSRLHGHRDPFPVPSGITASLWHRIERVPFRLAGRVTLEDRVLTVADRARARLDQEGVALGRQAAGPRLKLPFSAHLPCRACEPEQQPLTLYCGTWGSSEITVTIGLPLDLDAGLRPGSQRAPHPELPERLSHWEVFGVGPSALPWLLSS